MVPAANVPVIVALPDTSTVAAVTVPVNVGDAKSALLEIAVAMLTNSVLNSVPLIIFAGSPLGKASLVLKNVVIE
jgi:hypothetical protein